ncbi:MAG: SIR2 family protein [Gammaproteobacteria bacterium]|nr:SIR2 family protein [Gammaproteobacteria bacterium]
MKKTPISFLLGAGFSKPAGYPLAAEINEKFVGLKENEISIHTDGSAWFNGGKPKWDDSFPHLRNGRLFIERLLDYYCSSVISSPEAFHYETFYDWYKDIQNGCKRDKRVEDIAIESEGCLADHMRCFNFTFNQLVAQLLYKSPQELELGQDLSCSYALFLDLVRNLRREHVLHFHTLNHDVFFESLSDTDAIRGDLGNGFTELDSPYYGALWHNSKRKVRLPYFSGVFDSPINLYKLHGSIDQWIFPSKEQEIIKTKHGVGPNDLLGKVREGNEFNYERRYGDPCSEFLSGVRYKIANYKSHPYYKKVLKCFRSNLECSNVLIVIGYRFKDMEINNLLQRHFLSRSGSRVLIVDVKKSDLQPDIEKCSEFFRGGVSGFDYSKLMASICG